MKQTQGEKKRRIYINEIDHWGGQAQINVFLWYFGRGLQGKPGSVVLKKDKQNLIGISIGGGAPLCPCLYVVQVFDNTPASREGVLQAGDEIVGVNGKSLRGKTKVDVARAIQAVKVSFEYFSDIKRDRSDI